MNPSQVFDQTLLASDFTNNVNLSDNLFDDDSVTTTSLNLLATTATTNHDDQAFIIPSIFTEQISQTKLLASLILFTITLLCGYLPVRILLNQNYIQYAMFAGGGVLMATAFCHLIPEAHDNYRLINMQQLSSQQKQQQQQEQQQQLVGPQQQKSNLSLSHSHSHSHNQTPTFVSTNANNSAINSTTTTTTTVVLVSKTNHTNNHGEHFDSSHNHGGDTYGGLNVPYLEVTLCCGFFFMYLVEQLMVRFINNHTHEHPCDTSMGQLVVSSSGATISDNNSNRIASSAVSATSGITTNSISSGTATEFYKFIRGLLIVSAFGAHSIFDGVAIGSQESVEKVWTIFIAISCHKLIISAVVGLELYAATLESHLWTLVHLSIFSIMSPIGIILVVVAQNSLHINSSHPAMILLQSFATGTLLYIVFVEILQPKEDQAYEKNRLGKSISLITGFALMLLVLTLIDE